MFNSEELSHHLQTSETIVNKSLIFAEWNLNDPENIKRLGNYRYRPSYSASPYYLIPMNYDDYDLGNYYTGATDSDTVIESGLNSQDEPTLFVDKKRKMEMLFSLEECIKPFRPRSGINKVLYLNQFIDDARGSGSRRPRYYMASKDDQFKYWTSFRTEKGTPTPYSGQTVSNAESEIVRGLSFYDSVSNRNYIEDAAPFVVYKEPVPTNKIVIKMQTNTGEENLGNLRYGQQKTIEDPLYGEKNRSTPKKWRIEVLKENSWITAISFDEQSARRDGSEIIKHDGYLEVSYGLKIPERFSQFNYLGQISSESILPDTSDPGDAFLIKENENSRGVIFIYEDNSWQQFTPEYGWQLTDEEIKNKTLVAKELSDPDFFVENNIDFFREFEFIDGIRIVVQTMNKKNCTFDLIEFSPRLFAEITEKVKEFSVKKTMADMGNSSLPVDGLYASTGSISLMDEDFSFNENNVFDIEKNKGSIVYKYLNKNIKFIFYENIKDQDNDFYIPIKTLYSSGLPQTQSPLSNVSVDLRDFFFFLEQSRAPQLFLTDISLSNAVLILLDFIGFSNYQFKRITSEEIVIPYFFVEQGQNVAEVLQKLARASQTTMFFDEYNNLNIFSKEYVLPQNEDDRESSGYILGDIYAESSNDQLYKVIDFFYEIESLPPEHYDGAFISHIDDGIYVWSEQSMQWVKTDLAKKILQPNVIALSSAEKRVFNDGQINYTTRYLQRSIGSTSAALKIDEYKNYIYKPVLLWEASGSTNRQTINELAGQSSGLVLGAIPLGSNLTDAEPYSFNNEIYNNIIDLGENVYWTTNYQGYFYSSGEVIKYDAIEYSVSGLSKSVWISSNQQYQDYFSKLKFNGKMYPTGRVRIYCQPEFVMNNEELRIKDARPILVNGRGQFGTTIVSHSAGIDEDSHWRNNQNVYGSIQEASSFLFDFSKYTGYPINLENSNCGKTKVIGDNTYVADNIARSSLRHGLIKNFLADKNFTESELSYRKTTEPGAIQSSALVFSGPEVSETLGAQNFVSHVYKDFFDQNNASIPYKHYGTRMRVIGKVESGTNKKQTPSNAFSVYTGGVDVDAGQEAAPAEPQTTEQSVFIYGGSGGLAINVDKEKNTGYYFEILALTSDTIEDYVGENNLTTSTARISLETPPQTVNTQVYCWTEEEFDLVVGQTIVVTGLTDANDPEDDGTLLNGEYIVSYVAENKKSFAYNIGVELDTTSTTGGRVSTVIDDEIQLANVFFYKVVADENGNAIPYKLWTGLSAINVDSGDFYGQSRIFGEAATTVYDLAAEYVNSGSTRTFYLYLNDKQVAVVEDVEPLEEKNSVALFVRGSSKCMFENVYALSQNYSQNSVFSVQDGVSDVFGDQEINVTEAFRKYSISGIIQNTYLSGISSLEDPKYRMYFEEFGSIMREAAYFNVLYDRAFPALYAKLMKTQNHLKGYTVSGFYAWSYGAEFLIFNSTDFAIALDDTSGNYLRIMGVAFTQSTSNTISVDDLYKKRSNLLDNRLGSSNVLSNSLNVDQEYNRIKNSRDKFGKNDLIIETPYIQTTDAAEEVFSWIIDKVSKPRQIFGIKTFGTFNLQLGDIVKVKLQNNDGINVLSQDEKRFVIYQIDYSRSNSGLELTSYLVEV